MKKITILASVLLFAGLFQAEAQVGIGTPNPSNATMLDIVATDKGVLIPRVNLTATDVYAPIVGNEEESLLVFNTATSANQDVQNAVSPGFYYWRDSKWNRIINREDLDSVIQTINNNIEQVHDLINYIAPSNPNNLDNNNNPIVTENHSTVVWDATTESFFVVTYDSATASYMKTLINIEALIQNLETATFIKRIDADIDLNGTVITPTVYYYFSEQAIKDWMALDPANNTDPISDMDVNETGVVKIDIVGDIANNFEYILNQSITYEGEVLTIKEIIENISKEIDGNVIYVEVGGEMVFQYYDGAQYVTIDLGEAIAKLETETFLRKEEAELDTNGNIITPTVYYYFSEEAIKAWMALDPVNNTDLDDMPNTASHVVAIEIADDVANNFEYILNQSITYEGEVLTIKEIIENISKKIDGNVIYVEDGGEMVFQYYDGTQYVTIDLGEAIAKLETETFLRKEEAELDTNGNIITPTVYYYFSEEAIKAWMALDPVNNTDLDDMPNTASHVVAIEIADDVANNFEYILNQSITYEGEVLTIKEIIENISKKIDGNVIYVEDGGEMVFQYYDGAQYVTIDLGEAIAKLETETFLRKEEAELDTNGNIITPTVYYYFSEEAIKAWMALDPVNNTDLDDMPNTASHVVAIEIADDVANNFEYILNQSITYEGTTLTIEEIIKNVVGIEDGNVIYIADPNNAGEFIFRVYNPTIEEYEDLDLENIIRAIETKTHITRATITTDAESPIYRTITDAPVDSNTAKGEIIYKYEAEGETNYLNITEDLSYSIEYNDNIHNLLKKIIQEVGGNVYFGDLNIGGTDYTNVLYYYDDNGNEVLIDVATTLIENLTQSIENVLKLKNILGDTIENNTSIYTGDTIDGKAVISYMGNTTIADDHTAVTTGVTLTLPLGTTATALDGIVSISLYQSGVLVTSAVTDVEISGTTVNFNIGTGKLYSVLPQGSYQVIVYATIDE